MAFAIQVHRLADINSYEQAAEYFERRACRRSESKEYDGVPLHLSRHVNHQRLVKRGESYALRLYHTDVVVYHPDGSVTIDLSYASQSTAVFADHYLPYGLGARLYRYRVFLMMRGEFGLMKDYALRAPVTLTSVGEANWRVIDADRRYITKFTVTRINRKVANAAWRDPRAVALREYLKTIAGLGVVTTETWEAMNGEISSTWFGWPQALLSEALNDEQHWPALAARLMRTSYYAQLGEYGAVMPGDYEKTLREWVYKLAGAYYEEPLPEGTTHPKMHSVTE